LFIDDMNTPYYVRRRWIAKIICVAMIIATIATFAILLTPGALNHRSVVRLLTSLSMGWLGFDHVWRNLTIPIRIYRDRLEYLNRGIPVSGLVRITRVEKNGFVKFRIKARGWWPRFFLPFYFKCDPGSPKCAAFDALKNEFESAWRFPPVTTASSTRTL
jgi:hypothetical protein